MPNNNIDELLSDPNFKMDVWIEQQNKMLADLLSKEYQRNINRKNFKIP